MSRIARLAHQPLQLERLLNEDEGEGATYDEPETILAVYDPVESDLGVEDAARRTATVLTETEVATGDRIEGQVVTQVQTRYYRDGTVEHYRVTL